MKKKFFFRDLNIYIILHIFSFYELDIFINDKSIVRSLKWFQKCKDNYFSYKANLCNIFGRYGNYFKKIFLLWKTIHIFILYILIFINIHFFYIYSFYIHYFFIIFSLIFNMEHLNDNIHHNNLVYKYIH
jgi:hypothetical protein